MVKSHLRRLENIGTNFNDASSHNLAAIHRRDSAMYQTFLQFKKQFPSDKFEI